MTCQVSSQEYINGFCYNKCPAGYTGHNELCLQNCPEGFQDLGLTCNPPSVLRQTTKTFMSACAANQIDKNGDCYEPQTATFISLNGVQVPRASGCGCIRKTLSERVHCPDGYIKFNNGCVTKCPPGYEDIKDNEGNIVSMYCQAPCPKKLKSAETWTSLGDQCIKDFKSRTDTLYTGTNRNLDTGALLNRSARPVIGLPNTTLSYLASRPFGSSLQERVRKGQTIVQANAIFPDSWTDLFNDLNKLLLYGGLLAVVFFAGPEIFKAVGLLFSYIIKGAGSLAGKTLETAGTVVQTVGTSSANLVGSSLNIAASAENAAARRIDTENR